MKLISYLADDEEDHLAILVDGIAYNAHKLDKRIPDNMSDFLFEGEEGMAWAKELDQKIKSGKVNASQGMKLEKLELLAPVPFPTSTRDAYAFRQHVEAARRNRGVEMIPEFDEYPVFYFTNHNAIMGPGEIEVMPDHLQQLDFELEVAIVIGQEGRNIKAEYADDYIAGFMIMNDMSARLLQMEEMKLNLGPAKGKDFCTVLGPWLVTPDELEGYLVAPKTGHKGKAYDLKMSCQVNGKTVSEGNMADMDWTFAEIIERASYGVDLLPGDVIGSGTVGTGCFLELNGTGKRLDPNFQPQWLQPGDKVVMEVTGLGKLENTIEKAVDNFSILALKKQAAK
ncbi:MAG: fumarylacetoacetate hydrolase family protein [Chitinophagales bacterium]|nr:fumarylacetoacetate hydrolase family protein [Chitinophagales bacterium]